jgi:hypothetical protein
VQRSTVKYSTVQYLYRGQGLMRMPIGLITFHEVSGTRYKKSLPCVHDPVVTDHDPESPHVVLGLPEVAGTQPELHVAVHVVPVVLLSVQLYSALEGFSGLVVHTAERAAEKSTLRDHAL